MSFSEEILKIFKEAKFKNYPEFVLKHDLDNYYTYILGGVEEDHRYDLEWVKDDSYDEGREDGYNDGYDDGLREGKDEAHILLMQQMADEFIQLKRDIIDKKLTNKDISLRLTEILIKLDENEDISYTERGIQLEELDDPSIWD